MTTVTTIEQETTGGPTITTTEAQPARATRAARVLRPTRVARATRASRALITTGRPIVMKVKRRRKRRYSRGLKGLQKNLLKGTRVPDRLASAIAKGLKKYRKKADKSSRKKRDGMLKDFLKNAASGVGTTVRSSSKVPRDIAKVLSGRAITRPMRVFSRLIKR